MKVEQKATFLAEVAAIQDEFNASANWAAETEVKLSRLITDARGHLEQMEIEAVTVRARIDAERETAMERCKRRLGQLQQRVVLAKAAP